MTKEDITKFRDEIIGDKPYRVICDNEHIFYGNIPGYFPIIWDDDAETMITIDWSRDVYSDQRLPYQAFLIISIPFKIACSFMGMRWW